jgi:flagellar basal-body rod protein FlgC
MNDFIALDISGAGMSVQRERLRVIAENLANQHTTGPNGPYQRKDVVLASAPISTFQEALEGLVGLESPGSGTPVSSVRVSEIRGDDSEPIKVYDPTHPHRDEQGYVAYPNISIFREMTDLTEASRSYEANLAAAKATKEMLQAALDLIGR